MDLPDRPGHQRGEDHLQGAVFRGRVPQMRQGLCGRRTALQPVQQRAQAPDRDCVHRRDDGLYDRADRHGGLHGEHAGGALHPGCRGFRAAARGEPHQ